MQKQFDGRPGGRLKGAFFEWKYWGDGQNPVSEMERLLFHSEA